MFWCALLMFVQSLSWQTVVLYFQRKLKIEKKAIPAGISFFLTCMSSRAVQSETKNPFHPQSPRTIWLFISSLAQVGFPYLLRDVDISYKLIQMQGQIDQGFG